MNKKNLIPIILLSVLAVALLAVYLIVTKSPKPGNGQENKPSYFVIREIPTDRVDRLQIKTGNFEGVFVRDGEEWRHEENAFPVNQLSVGVIISIVASHLNAFERVKNPTSLSDYGFDNPNAVLWLYAGGEQLLKLSVGNKIPTQERYYAMVDGDDTVYIVSDNYYNYLVKDRSDFLENVKLPEIEEWTLLREITITEEDTVTFHAIYDEHNPYDYSGVGMFSWMIKEPLNGFSNADLNGDTWYDLLQRYLSVTYDRTVAYRPASYGTYGLDHPTTSITVRYADKFGREDYSYTMDFGSQTGDGGIYMRLRNMEWVFRMSNEAAAKWKEITIFDVCHKTVFFPSGNTFNRIVITAGGKRYELVNTHASSDSPVYTINGMTMPDDVFNEWSRAILSLKYSELVHDGTPGSEVMTIETEVADQSLHKNMRIVFYTFTDSVYLVSVNDKFDFAIDVRKINDFIAFMEDLVD